MDSVPMIRGEKERLIYTAITVLLCVGLCVCIGIRVRMERKSLSGPYDGIDIGCSGETIISILGEEPSTVLPVELFYADTIMVFSDFTYLDMTGQMTYWMKDDSLVMSVFHPEGFNYTRDIELTYQNQFEKDFGTVELSAGGFGFDASTVRYAYVLSSPVDSSVDETMVLLLMYYKRDALFILKSLYSPNLPVIVNDIQEVLFSE